MKNKILDDFLSERSAVVMKNIEGEIHKEVLEGICEYFGIEVKSLIMFKELVFSPMPNEKAHVPGKIQTTTLRLFR